VLHCHQVAVSSRFWDNGHQTYRGHDLDLSGSRDVIGHVTIRFPGTHFLYVLHCHRVAFSSRFLVFSNVRDVFNVVFSMFVCYFAAFCQLCFYNKDWIGLEYIGVTTLTTQGHVTSSATWPFDSQVPISYRCSIVTKSLSPAVSEILASKCIGVTTLTFRGHATSSVTWPFDSGSRFL